MKLNELLSSKYIKQGDIDGDTLVTIREVKKQNVAATGEPPEYKGVIYFDEFEKGMVLNATNTKRLGKYFGDDTDLWRGEKVVLFVDPDVEYGGEVKGGLRVKQHKNPAAKARAAVSDADVNRKLADAEDDSVPF